MAAPAALDLRHLQAIGLPMVCGEPTKSSPVAATTPADSGTKVALAPKAAPAPKDIQTVAVSDTTAGTDRSKTDHVFLTDTFLFELAGCEILEAALVPDAQPDGQLKLTVVLSRSIFHPQGGGQPADTGRLRGEGLPDLSVSFTSLRKDDGAILHDCIAEEAVIRLWADAVGKVQVTCCIDEARRRMAARVHSAGHLLDAAVTAVGLKWVPGKGYHFPDGPYVEYSLNEESRKVDPKKAGDKEQIVADIQSNLNRLLAEGGAVTVEYKDGRRHVAMAGEECPCGGTHVAELKQIGPVEIKKLQNKQGNVRLSYTVAAAA